MSTSTTLSMIVLILALGCRSTPGAEPHDMSVAHHEATAAREEAEAARWSSATNPTEENLREASRHRQMAADHRAASQALRDAEARACGGLREADRDTSPFAHREDLARVEPLTEPVSVGRGANIQRTVGAVVTFRAVPGMTAEWLQRLVDCHIARAASLGYDMPEMSYCPLMLREVEARVTSIGNGFAVAIRASDPDTVDEIQRRAQALVSAPAPRAPSP